MKITKKIVKKFLEISLNPVPVEAGTKVPLRKKHQTAFHEDEIDDFDWGSLEIGVSTGFASLNLEVLDFDLKNTEEEDFLDKYNQNIPEGLMNRLVIQKTPSGGFHYLYRCDSIEGNQKIARNERGEAVIETRGINGYIKCAPSDGYELVSSNTFAEIPYITKEERGLLLSVAKQMDRLNFREIYKKYSSEDLDHIKKFKRYNEDEEIGIELLYKAGWEYHSTNGEWVNMTRPDSSSHELHGGYNTELKFFQTFSTAQDTFQERRGYNNHHLFAELECDGNYKKAYAILYEQGWGEEEEGDEEGDESLSFLTRFEAENEFLDQARRDEVPLGVSTGWDGLDRHFRLKKNSFYFFLGLDNIGKSTLLSSFMVASNVLNGFKWGISSPEAQVYSTRRVLIEAALGGKISSLKGKKARYDELLVESRKNFFIIDNDKHLTIDEVLERGKTLYQKYGIDFLLIDPFSFYSGSGDYRDDTDILSKIRVFCQNYCSVVVVDHPTTDFARRSKTKDGFTEMPTKYDASGGNMKANRCDDFICFHRIINHPDEEVRRTMQISVQKVKDKSTGGEPHNSGEWDELVWDTRDGFTGYWDEEGGNPMYKAQVAKLGVRAEMKRMSAEDAFGV